MRSWITHLILDQEGGAAMEYALIAGIVSLALFVGLLLTRVGLQNLYQGIADALTEAVNAL
ncbi:MAG: Flp family type IVb pilin [Candidatus Binatia bacterium]